MEVAWWGEEAGRRRGREGVGGAGGREGRRLGFRRRPRWLALRRGKGEGAGAHGGGGSPLSPVSVDRTEEEGGGVGFGLAELGQGGGWRRWARREKNKPRFCFFSVLLFPSFILFLFSCFETK